MMLMMTVLCCATACCTSDTAGPTVALARSASRFYTETGRWPASRDELLTYAAARDIPPVHVDPKMRVAIRTNADGSLHIRSARRCGFAGKETSIEVPRPSPTTRPLP
jgi:hypothetical protein